MDIADLHVTSHFARRGNGQTCSDEAITFFCHRYLQAGEKCSIELSDLAITHNRIVIRLANLIFLIHRLNLVNQF